MIYVKSFLVGLLAAVLAAALLGTTAIFVMSFVMRFIAGRIRPSAYSINFGSPFLWVVWLGVFGIGFYWEYHRLANR